MKNRTLVYALIGLLAVVSGFLWFVFSSKGPESTKVFNATINRDCAPWDGAAFTVSIPYDAWSVIEISIWRSPSFKFPVTFSFPDQTGKVGSAIYQRQFGATEQLSGSVFFLNVGEGGPITGEFNLWSASGDQFQGKIKAIWGNKLVMCG